MPNNAKFWVEAPFSSFQANFGARSKTRETRETRTTVRASEGARITVARREEDGSNHDDSKPVQDAGVPQRPPLESRSGRQYFGRRQSASAPPSPRQADHRERGDGQGSGRDHSGLVRRRSLREGDGGRGSRADAQGKFEKDPHQAERDANARTGLEGSEGARNGDRRHREVRRARTSRGKS